jgi:uncharacterized protein
MNASQRWIRRLRLRPHPEGGFYRETYRSAHHIPKRALGPGFRAERCCSTAIYFLLQQPGFSAFHRLRSDELWHFHAGGALALHLLHEAGGYAKRVVGLARSRGCEPQLCIPAGTWFAAELAGRSGYSLVSCTVAPGFDFADFELADRDALARRFPEHRKLIRRLTRA